MKLFKTDSKGNFSVNITGIEVEAIITLNTTLENDLLDVMANNTLKLVTNLLFKCEGHCHIQFQDASAVTQAGTFSNGVTNGTTS